MQGGIKNEPDHPTAHLRLIAHAKKHCSREMQAFLFKIRARLPALTDDIWQWEHVDAALADAERSRIDAMHSAATSPCVCGGAWAAAVVYSLLANRIPIGALGAGILAALSAGRRESTPVIVLAGTCGGEGKSMLLRGLNSVFGTSAVLQKPEVRSFPLVDLPGKKVVLLDDWRFSQSILSYATQCLWYDGSAVSIVWPQNQPGVSGHYLYQGTAPIFATTKAQGIAALHSAAAIDPLTGCPKDGDASMIIRRLKVYTFRVRVAKPPIALPACGHCFATLILEQGRHSA